MQEECRQSCQGLAQLCPPVEPTGGEILLVVIQEEKSDIFQYLSTVHLRDSREGESTSGMGK